MFIKVYKIIAASDANQHFNFLNNASIRSSFEDQKTGVPLLSIWRICWNTDLFCRVSQRMVSCL